MIVDIGDMLKVSGSSSVILFGVLRFGSMLIRMLSSMLIIIRLR